MKLEAINCFRQFNSESNKMTISDKNKDIISSIERLLKIKEKVLCMDFLSYSSGHLRLFRLQKNIVIFWLLPYPRIKIVQMQC